MRAPTPTRPSPEPSKPPEVTPLAIPQRAVSLDEIVTHEDPLPIYADLEKIGQGASGAVFVAVDVRTKYHVAIKQMVVKQQVKKDVIVNEICIMKASRHPNIINFIDSYLVDGTLWVRIFARVLGARGRARALDVSASCASYSPTRCRL